MLNTAEISIWPVLVRRWTIESVCLYVVIFQCVCDSVFQSVQSVVSVLCGSEQLIGSLPEVKWAKQVLGLVNELQNECLHMIVTHLPRVTHTAAFHNLRRVQLSTGYHGHI